MCHIGVTEEDSAMDPRIAIVGHAASVLHAAIMLRDTANRWEVNVSIFAQSGSAFAHACHQAGLPVNLFKSRDEFISSVEGQATTDVIFLNNTAPLLRAALYRLNQVIVTHTVQVGLLEVPYTPVLPYVNHCYTFGLYWDRVFSFRNAHLKCQAVGSMKVDYLASLRDGESLNHITVLGQPINARQTALVHGFSWAKYVCEVKRHFGIRVIYRPHPADKRTIAGVKTSSSWTHLAKSKLVITYYSTLGLETAAAGIPTVSFVPIPSPLVVDFTPFGIPTVTSLSQLSSHHHVDKRRLWPFMKNIAGGSAAGEILSGICNAH